MDNASKKNIFSTGYSWLKNQFSAGSHHENKTPEPINPIQIPLTEFELPTQTILDSLQSNLPIKSTQSEHSMDLESNTHSVAESESKPAAKTKTREKKHRRSHTDRYFNLEDAQKNSAVSDLQERHQHHDKAKKVRHHVKRKTDQIGEVTDVQPIRTKVLETVAELSESTPELDFVPVNILSESQVQVELKPAVQVEMQSEIKTEVPVQVEPESEPEAKPEPEREDFTTALRHQAFQTHKRNSQRLSGQWPTYDEQAFIQGTKEVNFIHESNGKGTYWPNPSKPGLVAGEIDREKMDLSTYQRLGYQAAQGDVAAREEIENAKKRNRM